MIDENSIQNEQTLIGCILIDERVAPRIIAELHKDDLQADYDKAIYEATAQLLHDGKSIDPVTIRNRCAENGLPGIEGMNQYMMRLMEITPTAAHYLEYIDAVRRDAMRRKLIGISEILQADALTADPVETTKQIQTVLDSVMQTKAGTGVHSAAEAVTAFYDQRAAIERGDPNVGRVATGIPFLDRETDGGLQRCALHVLAAPTSVGKSAMALNIATNVAKRGVPVLYFSLEMDAVELVERCVSREVQIPCSVITGDDGYGEEIWDRVVAGCSAVAKMPLTIVDDPDVTITYIEALARATPNIGLVVVDYIGLLPQLPRMDARQTISYYSRSLKNLAQQLHIPVLVLAQMNRAASKEKAMELYNLAESASMERDAYTVTIMSENEELTEQYCRSGECVLNLKIAKNRGGRRNVIRQIIFDRSRMTAKKELPANQGEPNG